MPAATPTNTDPGPAKGKTTKDGWKKQAIHPGVTLPSGAVVSIRLPNIPKMIKGGTIPNGLIDQALEQQSAEKITREMLEQTWEYTKFIVPLTVVSPAVDEDDVEDLPVEDLEMVTAFASRSIDLDAVGHQLGGLETQKSFRDFRGIESSDQDGLGLEGDG